MGQQSVQRPTRTRFAHLMWVTAHTLQEGFFGLFGFVVARGKTRACARVLVESVSLAGHSLESGFASDTPYLAPADDRDASERHGQGSLPRPSSARRHTVPVGAV